MADHIPWDSLYRARGTGRLPWHSGAAEPGLFDLVRNEIVSRCRALDVGCGQGTEAVFLALAGFEVTGVDISRQALSRAAKLARLLGAKVRLRRADALRLPFRAGAFGFANDRGCFHHVAPPDRARYAAEVARVLRPGGQLFLRAFSDRADPTRGPLCLTAKEIRAALAPHFDIASLRRYEGMGNGGPPSIPMWACLAKRRR
ncbi:MAG: class I SAM-dependent methyltransferase [Planctomycetes bacterium]|nr:class I SAM-dependent methyltransferase [Planctomycetota bacterium]